VCKRVQACASVCECAWVCVRCFFMAQPSSMEDRELALPHRGYHKTKRVQIGLTWLAVSVHERRRLHPHRGCLKNRGKRRSDLACSQCTRTTS
jgi:hypothetical protein